MKKQISKMISPNKIGSSDFEEFELDQNVDWVRELLIELNENAVEKSEEAYLDQTNLDIKLKLKSFHEHAIGLVLLAEAEVSAHYATSCTLSLTEMFENTHFTVKGCFLPENLENTEEYEEATELFLAGELRELHFLSKGQADLKEFIHEHIYLNINPYPKLNFDEDEDGLIVDSSKLKN